VTVDEPEAPAASALPAPSDGWTDLGLTLPIFLFYHLGVVFLPIKNAADPVTQELRALASHSLLAYAGLTLVVGAVFIAVLALLGRGHAFEPKRFVLIGVEGALYAVIMRFVSSYAVGSLPLARGGEIGTFASLVMALGAGFYEEIAFRVALFGGGAWLLRRLFAEGRAKRWAATAAWAVASAVIFSGWHYVGALGDSFDLATFVFRAVCGLVLTTIFALRGFAPAVWTHAIYDVWVMLLG
jgi:hypothetical protein